MGEFKFFCDFFSPVFFLVVEFLPIPWISPQISQDDTEKVRRGGCDDKKCLKERKGSINESNLMSYIDALVFKQEVF